MSDNNTIATVFELAIITEKKLQDLYHGLSKQFQHFPNISDFWKGMLKDEIMHAQTLENMRDSLTKDQLNTPADYGILLKAKNASRFSVEDLLSQIMTLDDAYKAAHELENSEVNVVFEFLAAKFIYAEKRKKFVNSAINDHLLKIMKFSNNFGNRQWRRSIAAQKKQK